MDDEIDGTFALIGVSWPIVFIKRGRSPEWLTAIDVELLEVDFEGEELSVNKEVAIDLFGEAVANDDFDSIPVTDYYINTVTVG